MYRDFFKRGIDFLIALVALVCISPVLAVVTIWLHFANKGGRSVFPARATGSTWQDFQNHQIQDDDR